MTKDEVLQALADSRMAFLAAVEGLSDEALIEPGVIESWSIKDILYHLTMWEAELVKLLWQASQGLTPTSVQMQATTVDEQNAAWSTESRTRPLELVWEDFHAVRKQTTRRVSAFREADFEDLARFTWLDGDPLWVWIANDTFEHEEEHAVQIKAWRAAN
jgi:hypothetical protein